MKIFRSIAFWRRPVVHYGDVYGCRIIANRKVTALCDPEIRGRENDKNFADHFDEITCKECLDYKGGG